MIDAITQEQWINMAVWWVISMVASGIVAKAKSLEVATWVGGAFFFGWLSFLMLVFVPRGKEEKASQ